MDFGALLDFAKQNELPNKEVKCYRTTFGPPKKEPKKCLSENIRKFLARKEEEEKQKVTDANKKRGELLALRAQDSKANKRVRAMLKSTKAANKAAIDDARDDVNTAVTMAGPSQPDEDDYGYVSQEASAFYNKLMDKYSSIPNSEPNFSKTSQTVKDLPSTKDRVRMALLKEEEEEAMGHKRKRRKAREDKGKQDDDDDDANLQCAVADRELLHQEPRSSKISREKPEPEVKKRKPSAPPPMDFAELLKVAAQKQFEPIKIEKKDKDEEEDRPMTKKQREEYLREKEHRLRKEEMARAAAAAKSKEKSQPRSSETQVNNNESRSSATFKTPSIPRIPKLNGAKAIPESQTRVSGSDFEAQARRSAQQTEPREGNSSKHRMAEMGKQGNVRPPSSFREQEYAEEKRNSMQTSNKPKDINVERKPVQSVPSSKERRDKPVVESRKQPTAQPSRPVIKEEQRQSNQLTKTVMKEERLVNNQQTRPVVKEERRLSNQSPRPAVREETRPYPTSKDPQRSLKPDSAPMSKQNRPPSQSSASTKQSPNVVKKTDGRLPKSEPVGHAGGDMLRERLTSASSQSLPQKNQQGPSQMVKKDSKMKVPEKSKSIGNAPPAEATLPKAMPNRPSATKPQGMSKERMKGGPPERRQEAPEGNRRPPSMDDRRPPSMDDRRQPSTADRRPPSTADRRPPSTADRRPPSMADRRPPSMDDRRPPSTADRRPPSMDDRRPPSTADRRPPSMDDRRPPSMDDRRPPSTADRRPPSMDDRRPPSTADRRPSTDDRRPPSTADRRPPSTDDRRPPSTADRRPPSMADRRPPSMDDRRPPSMDDRRPPSTADRRPPSMADRRPPSMADRRPPSMADRRPPSMADRRPPSMADRRPFGSRDAPRGRPMHPQDARRRPAAKRRIESDDEYDSELEDFIDDGPEEEEDYSKYIKEIFGYDRSRYTVRDYEEDEDECMESSFAQQMKEEFVSTKLGIMEDLEDIKKEQMEKMKKKMVMSKKKKV